MKISRIEAKQIPDSRSEATLEVSLELSDGSSGTAAMPQGKSTGSHEAVSLAAPQAVADIALIAGKLEGGDFDQHTLERELFELDGTANKSRLGANAILGVSVAFAKAVSSNRHLPLWQYLRQLYDGKLGQAPPKLCMNMIEGGLHAANGLETQEYWLIPRSDSVKTALDLGRHFYQALAERFKDAPIGYEGGFAPKFSDDFKPLQIYSEAAKSMDGDFEFGIDAAASGIKTDTGDLYRRYMQMVEQFGLSYIEDPFGEEDFELFAQLKAEVGTKTVIVGDDLTTTNLARMKLARQHNSVGGIIIKPNQIGSLGETLAAVKLAREFDWQVIVSHRSQETMDDFSADIAWAVMADGVKFGAPAPPERLVKYERLAVIESADNG